MTYTFDDLKADVKKEAEALRVHATKEELGKLDIETFAPDQYDGCIYGQCTTNCHSERAIELIQLCTPMYFKEKMFEDVEDQGVEGIIRNANGTTVRNFISGRSHVSYKSAHYSAIEAYILLPKAKNANLIAFLRGESETLDL